MLKMLEATCVAGVVSVEETPCPDATILSDGTGESEGVALLQEDEMVYLTSNASDIKDLLEQVVTALNQLTSALTTLDAKPVGGSGSAPAPAVAANITAITNASTALATLKEMLK